MLTTLFRLHNFERQLKKCVREQLTARNLIQILYSVSAASLRLHVVPQGQILS